jgi:hypothetical protein
MEAIQRVVMSALQVEIPTAAAMPALQMEIPTTMVATSSPDPSVREEGLQADLDTTVGADASSLDPKAARILSEAVTATREVHQLRDILPIVSRVSDYYEKSVILKRLSHACLIIKILA